MNCLRMTPDEKFDYILSLVPDQPKSWTEATDEIRDLARKIRIYYNDRYDFVKGDDNYVEGINWRKFNDPAKWNQAYKTQARALWNELLDDEDKLAVLENLSFEVS